MQTAQRKQMRYPTAAEMQNRLARQPRTVTEQERRSERPLLAADRIAEPLAKTPVQPPQGKHRRVGSLACHRAVAVVGTGHNRDQAVRAQGGFLIIRPVARKLPHLSHKTEAVALGKRGTVGALQKHAVADGRSVKFGQPNREAASVPSRRQALGDVPFHRDHFPGAGKIAIRSRAEPCPRSNQQAGAGGTGQNSGGAPRRYATAKNGKDRQKQPAKEKAGKQNQLQPTAGGHHRQCKTRRGADGKCQRTFAKNPHPNHSFLSKIQDNIAFFVN